MHSTICAVSERALESERARTEKKVTATMNEVRAFYDAMMPRIGEILDYLE